jgi:hypothetical protein
LGDLKVEAAQADLKAAVTQVQTEITRIIDGGESGGSIGLKEATDGISASLRVVESSDRAVPAQALAVYEQSNQAMKARIAEWAQLKTGPLSKLNDQLRQAKLVPIASTEIELEVEHFMSH